MTATGLANAETPVTSVSRVRWPPPRLSELVNLLAPALIYLCMRLLGVAVLAVMGSANGVGILRALTAWDGQWYLTLAADGYDGAAAIQVDGHGEHGAQTPKAFFPGYPTVTRWVSELIGLPMTAAALTVTLVSGVFTAYALARMGRLVQGGSARTGYVLVALFAATPMSVVLSMAYTESMFCMFAAWSLVFVLQRRWVAAGTCCALAGLVRPTALALVLAVGLAAVVCVVHRRDGRHPLVCGLLAPAGLVGYLWWAGAQVRPDAALVAQLRAWSELEDRGWNTGFDGGVSTLKFIWTTLAKSDSVMGLGTVATLIGALSLLVVALWRRLEWPLLVYAIGVLAMDLGSASLMHAKGRLLVPAFTLLIPAAIGLARRHTSTAVLVLAAVGLASAWFGAHSLTVWKYAM